MTNEAITDRVMFTACSDVLDRAIAPIHYAELTRRAMALLGADEYDIRRRKEDVRERMLEKGRFGSMYNTRCEGIKTEWVLRESIDGQRDLLVGDPFEIKYCEAIAKSAESEAACRQPYMRNKYGQSEASHLNAIASGLIVEHHVRHVFASQWIKSLRNADNHMIWRNACSHDFKLNLDGRWYDVDVCRPDRYGDSGCKHYKTPVHIHIVADRIGDSIWIDGWSPGRDFKGIAPTHVMRNIRQLFFILNCNAIGINFREAAKMRLGKARIK